MPDLRCSAGKALLSRERQLSVRVTPRAKDSRQRADRESEEADGPNQADERIAIFQASRFNLNMLFGASVSPFVIGPGRRVLGCAKLV